MYQLKPGQESFQVVAGPKAGVTYHRGRKYDEIPEAEAHRFHKAGLAQGQKGKTEPKNPQITQMDADGKKNNLRESAPSADKVSPNEVGTWLPHKSGVTQVQKEKK